MPTSFVTDTEVEALQSSELKRDTPFLIRGVRQTQFSIARFYGGATFNGNPYTYFADSDELIRDDVLKFVKKLRKKTR